MRCWLRVGPHQHMHLVHRDDAIIGRHPDDTIHIQIILHSDIPRRIEFHEAHNAILHEIHIASLVIVLLREEDMEFHWKWIQRSKVLEVFPVNDERQFSITDHLGLGWNFFTGSRGISW